MRHHQRWGSTNSGAISALGRNAANDTGRHDGKHSQWAPEPKPWCICRRVQRHQWFPTIIVLIDNNMGKNIKPVALLRGTWGPPPIPLLLQYGRLGCTSGPWRRSMAPVAKAFATAATALDPTIARSSAENATVKTALTAPTPTTVWPLVCLRARSQSNRPTARPRFSQLPAR